MPRKYIHFKRMGKMVRRRLLTKEERRQKKLERQSSPQPLHSDTEIYLRQGETWIVNALKSGELKELDQAHLCLLLALKGLH